MYRNQGAVESKGRSEKAYGWKRNNAGEWEWANRTRSALRNVKS